MFSGVVAERHNSDEVDEQFLQADGDDFALAPPSGFRLRKPLRQSLSETSGRLDGRSSGILSTPRRVGGGGLIRSGTFAGDGGDGQRLSFLADPKRMMRKNSSQRRRSTNRSPHRFAVPQCSNVTFVEFPSAEGPNVRMFHGDRNGSITIALPDRKIHGARGVEFCTRLYVFRFTFGPPSNSGCALPCPQPPQESLLLRLEHVQLQEVAELLGQVRNLCEGSSVPVVLPDNIGSAGDCRCSLCRQVWGSSRRLLRQHSTEADQVAAVEAEERSMIYRWAKSSARTAATPVWTRRNGSSLTNATLQRQIAAVKIVRFVRDCRSGALARCHGAQALRAALRQLAQARGDKSIAEARSVVRRCRAELRTLVTDSLRTESVNRLLMDPDEPPQRELPEFLSPRGRHKPLHTKVLLHGLALARDEEGAMTHLLPRQLSSNVSHTAGVELRLATPPTAGQVCLDTWFKAPEGTACLAEICVSLEQGNRPLLLRMTLNCDGTATSGRKAPKCVPGHVYVCADSGATESCFYVQGFVPHLFDGAWHSLECTVWPLRREVHFQIDGESAPGSLRSSQGSPAREMLPRCPTVMQYPTGVFWRPRLWSGDRPIQARTIPDAEHCTLPRTQPPDCVSALSLTKGRSGVVHLGCFVRSGWHLDIGSMEITFLARPAPQTSTGDQVLLGVSGRSARSQALRVILHPEKVTTGTRRAIRVELCGSRGLKRESLFPLSQSVDDGLWHRFSLRIHAARPVVTVDGRELKEIVVLNPSLGHESRRSSREGTPHSAVSPGGMWKNCGMEFGPLRSSLCIGGALSRGDREANFSGFLHDVRVFSLTESGEGELVGRWLCHPGPASPIIPDESGNGWHAVHRLPPCRKRGLWAIVDSAQWCPCSPQVHDDEDSSQSTKPRRPTTTHKTSSGTPKRSRAVRIIDGDDVSMEEFRWSDGITHATRAELGRRPVQCYERDWAPPPIERTIGDIRLWRDPKGTIWDCGVLDRLEADLQLALRHLVPKDPIEVVAPVYVYTASLGSPVVWASWPLHDIRRTGYQSHRISWARVPGSRIKGSFGPWSLPPLGSDLDLSTHRGPDECDLTLLAHYDCGLSIWYMSRPTESEYLVRWQTDNGSSLTPLEMPAQLWLPRPVALHLQDTGPMFSLTCASPAAKSSNDGRERDSEISPVSPEDDFDSDPEGGSPFCFTDDPLTSFPFPGVWTYLMARSSVELLEAPDGSGSWRSAPAITLQAADLAQRCLAERNQERRNVTLEDAFFTSLYGNELVNTPYPEGGARTPCAPRATSAIILPGSPSFSGGSSLERESQVLELLAKEKHGDENWTPGQIAEFLELQLVTKAAPEGEEDHFLASLSGKSVVAHVESGETERLWRVSAEFPPPMQLYFLLCAAVRHEQDQARDAVADVNGVGKYVCRQMDSTLGTAQLPLHGASKTRPVLNFVPHPVSHDEFGVRAGRWVLETEDGPQDVPLRDVDLHVLGWMLPQMIPFIWHLDHALSSSTAARYTRERSYRGLANVRLPEGLYEYGSVVCWAAFSSASESSGTAMAFTKEGNVPGDGGGAVFSLVGRTCRNISRYSRFSRERETLFPRNTYWSVRSMLSHEQQQILEVGIQVFELQEVDEFAVLENHVRLLIQRISSAHSMSSDVVPLAENLFRVAARLQTRDADGALSAALDVRGEVLYRADCESLVTGLRDLGADEGLIVQTLREVCDGRAPLVQDGCRAIQAVICLVSLAGGPQSQSISGVNWHGFLTAQDLRRRVTPRRRTINSLDSPPQPPTDFGKATGSALHVAVQDPGLVPYVSRLVLDFGLHVDERDSEGRQPLHIAAAKGHLTAVRDLIDAGAERDGEELSTRRTPLHYLAQAPGLELGLRRQDHLEKSIQKLMMELEENKAKLESIRAQIRAMPEAADDLPRGELDMQEEIGRQEIVEDYGAWRGMVPLVLQKAVDEATLLTMVPVALIHIETRQASSSAHRTPPSRRSRGAVAYTRNEARLELMQQLDETTRRGETLRSQIGELRSQQEEAGIDCRGLIRALATPKARSAEDFRGLTAYDYAEWIQRGSNEAFGESSDVLQIGEAAAVLSALRYCGCESKPRVVRVDERRLTKQKLRRIESGVGSGLMTPQS